MIIRNEQAGAITVAGVVLQPGAQEDFNDIPETELFDARVVTSTGEQTQLAAALDEGVVSAPTAFIVPPATIGDLARSASVAFVLDATRDGGAYNYRARVDTVAELAGLTDPQDGDHAAVKEAGTLYKYENAAWGDTGINAVFTDWIPPVGPSPLPINLGTIEPDLDFSFNVGFQSSVGAVYRVGPVTGSGYNYAGFASTQVVSQAGDYFEFPSIIINTIQGLGLASTDTLEGNGPNQDGVATPGVFCTPPSNFYAYTGRDAMGYLKADGLYTTGSQNGGGIAMYQPTAAERAESGIWSSGGRVRVGLDAQYHFYIATWLTGAQVWKTLFRSNTPMPTQSYRFVWAGFYSGSVLSQLPNQVVNPPAPGGYSDLFYVKLDGFDEYVDVGTQPELSAILDYGQPWAFGCTIGNDWNPTSILTPKYTLLRNGNNAIYINPGGNTAPYLSAGSATGGANTWSQVKAGDRLLFQSNGTSIQYAVNGVLKWNSSIVSSVVAANAPNGQLTIGQKGPISSFLQGGIDNCWFMGRPLVGFELAEAGLGGNPQNWSFYNELIGFYLMGEGGAAAFPDIADLTGNLTDAVLVNGESGDFTPY